MEQTNTPYIQILDRLYTPIFSPSDIEYYTRENSLKRNILRAISGIEENVNKPDLFVPSPWQKKVIERNISGLMTYLDNLHNALEKEKIIKYVKGHTSSFRDFRYEKDEMIIFLHSYYTTVIYDVLWSENISASDVINLSQRFVNEKNLSAKFNDMLSYIEKSIIPYFEASPLYKTKVPHLKEAIFVYKKKFFKSSSILLISSIEGLVKTLGQFLIEKQEIDLKEVKKPIHSLDAYLENIPWKSDYKIDVGKYMFLTGNYIFDRDYKVDGLKEIDLKTRLQFLKRKYKEDRNSILHGDNIAFGEVWDLYVNFSALNEVYHTIMYYHNQYK